MGLALKIINGWAFPNEDEFMVGKMTDDNTYQKTHLDAAMRWVKIRGKLDLAIDGGAHTGTWSQFMARDFKRVISFEPSPDTFEALTHNMRNADNAELRNQALGAGPGWVSMSIEGLEKAIATKNTGARYVVEGGPISRVAIDSLGLSALDFLKLDVEGSEPNVLNGARKALLQFKPIVLFEDKSAWKAFGFKRHAPQDILTALGARHLERVEMDEIWGWI